MRRPRRKYSKLSLPQNRARLGRLIVMVEEGPVTIANPDGIHVSGNTILPDEVVTAAKLWLRNEEYAQMDLGEYLHKMFNPEDYA